MMRGLCTCFLILLAALLLLDGGCQPNRTNTPALANPAAPVLTTIQVVSSDRIRIDWSYSDNYIDGFYIEREVGQDSIMTRLANMTSGARTYTDYSLQSETTYRYRIKAYRSTYVSDPSVVLSATTLPDAPVAISVFSAILQSSSVAQIAWQYPAITIDSFQVERRTGQTAYHVVATPGRTIRNTIDSGLAVATSYTYRIRAFNISGVSPYSNESTVNTAQVPPAAPSNLHLITNTPGLIKIAWHDNANDADGYQIERRVAGPDTFALLGRHYRYDTTYTDQTVSRITNYEYRVSTYNANGYSAYSNVLSVTSMEALPGIPFFLGAAALSYNSIQLRFRSSTTNVDSLCLQRKVGASGNYSTLTYPHANDTTFIDTGLVHSTAYSYRLFAINRIGQSEYSNEISVTTPDITPNAPSNLTARALSTSRITLYWQVNSNNETGFRVDRKIGVDGTFTPVGTTLAHLHSWDDFNCSSSTVYGYQVVATGTGSNSTPSNTAYAMTNTPAQELGSFTTAGIPRSILMRESMAYISSDTAGIQVVNMLQPGNPTVVGSISLPNYTYDISLVNDTAYCANDLHSLQIVAMGNPAQPQYLNYFNLPGLAHSITVVNHLAYLACGNGGLQIVRVFNPSQLSSTGSFQLSDFSATAEQVVVLGNYAYVAYGWGGVRILDVSTPSAISEVGSMVITTAQAEGIVVANNIAYVAYGYAGLHIYDVSNPATPIELSSVPPNDYSMKVTLTGHYAIVADRGNGIQMINVANPSQPIYAGSYTTPSRAINLTVVGNIAYVCDLETGIRIIQMDLP